MEVINGPPGRTGGRDRCHGRAKGVKRAVFAPAVPTIHVLLAAATLVIPGRLARAGPGIQIPAQHLFWIPGSLAALAPRNDFRKD